MIELHENQVDHVSGGIVPVVVGVAVLGWLSDPDNRDQVGQFFQGVADGIIATRDAHS